MTDKTTEGYAARPDDIEGMLRNLCAYALSEPEPLQRYVELSHQQVLFDGLVAAIRRERGRALADVLTLGVPIASVAEQAKLGTPTQVRSLITAAGLTMPKPPKAPAKSRSTKAAPAAPAPVAAAPDRPASDRPAADRSTAAPAPASNGHAPAAGAPTPPTAHRSVFTAPPPVVPARRPAGPPAAAPTSPPPAGARSAVAPPPDKGKGREQAKGREAEKGKEKDRKAKTSPPPPRVAPPAAAAPQPKGRRIGRLGRRLTRHNLPTLPITVVAEGGRERVLTAAERVALGLPAEGPLGELNRRPRDTAARR